jgi:3',5'-cyclic AMP phosphodiesterase CpdA
MAEGTRDGSTRRQALECMVWAGAGVLWTLRGGVPRSRLMGTAEAAEPTGFTFVQISDSHLGFKGATNPDTPATLQAAIDLIKAGPRRAMMIHTGDVSHLSRDAQFDTAERIMGGAGLDTHVVPGEHDVLVDDGRGFLDRFTKGGPRGWYGFDQAGVHFVGLNNVQNPQAGGMGRLGDEQLAWLRDDLAGRAASQPIVVFAHIPLWTVYAAWGWGTDDGAAALSLLRRFGSVTVLNGHIHQVMQKVEGQVAFHTARSTAFPQPAPGTAPSPGPIKNLPPGRLRSLLGITRVSERRVDAPLAIIDTTLAA